MHNSPYHGQDDHTVVLDRQAETAAERSPLTDYAAAPQGEPLHERLRHAARRSPAERLDLGGNPLVAAATPLLVELARLRRGEDRVELGVLHERLSAELKHFEHCALQEGSDSRQILAARYVLCTVLDEAISTSPWGEAGDWSRTSLLSAFHGETFGGEKVFLLLERLSTNPAQHLPTLELIYLCLALGFEGKYRILPRGGVELENVRNRLYRRIRHLRGEVPRDLSPHWQGLRPERRHLVRIVPWWLVGLFTLLCLGVTYGAFAWVLEQQREAVLRPFHTVADQG